MTLFSLDDFPKTPRSRLTEAAPDVPPAIPIPAEPQPLSPDAVLANSIDQAVQETSAFLAATPVEVPETHPFFAKRRKDRLGRKIKELDEKVQEQKQLTDQTTGHVQYVLRKEPGAASGEAGAPPKGKDAPFSKKDLGNSDTEIMHRVLSQHRKLDEVRRKRERLQLKVRRIEEAEARRDPFSHVSRDTPAPQSRETTPQTVRQRTTPAPVGSRRNPFTGEPVTVRTLAPPPAPVGWHKYASPLPTAPYDAGTPPPYIPAGTPLSFDPNLLSTSPPAPEITSATAVATEMGTGNEIVARALALPTIDVMRPEANKLSLFSAAGIDIRMNSTENHQDGVAYNPETNTVVVCDGMGGIGQESILKDHFGWALAHAVAGIKDITGLTRADLEPVVGQVPEILKQKGVDPTPAAPSAVKSTLDRGRIVGSTIAAVQKVSETEWTGLTLGDSSILVIGENGDVKQGYGEAYQEWVHIGSPMNRTVRESILNSYVGLRQDLSPIVETRVNTAEGTATAELGKFHVEPGDHIVVVSDAYLQKSTLAQLLKEIDTPAGMWNETHSDDTTLAIIDPFALAT